MNYTSISLIEERIIQLRKRNKNQILLILIGGCARSGKSTLTKKLANSLFNKGLNVLTIPIDSWLIGFDKRSADMTVLDRYDTEKLKLDLEKLLNGNVITPPVYDPVSRKRVAEAGKPISIESGVVILEGVIAFAVKKIRDKSDIKLFVTVDDSKRIRRLIDFYSRIKQVEKKEYKKTILEREKEEVPFIKGTIKHADFIYSDDI